MTKYEMTTKDSSTLEVCWEESRKKVILMAQANQLVTEGSALAAWGTPNPSNNNQPRKKRPWCVHYWKPGHTKDMC